MPVWRLAIRYSYIGSKCAKHLTIFVNTRIVKSVFLLSILICCACSHKAPVQPSTSSERWSGKIDSLKIKNVALLDTSGTIQLYRKKNFQLVWLDSTGLNHKGDSMLAIVRHASQFGLLPADYHLNVLDSLTKDGELKPDPSIDIYLTDGFLAMAFHLKNGRVDPKTLKRLRLSNTDTNNRVLFLREALVTSRLLGTLIKQEPSSKSYQTLRRKLEKLTSVFPLDTTTAKRIRTLHANLERLRWQKSVPPYYVSVNIPSFKLRLIKNDTIKLESNVIVGKFVTKTPLLESVIRSIIIYPYWHVPRSILAEVLPSVQQDTSYLTKHNFDVLDRKGNNVKVSSIDWDAYSEEDFPYVLRQREGSENTMGVIKFIFANRYGVYLHDTNARGLFRKKQRALSHGCVRVQKAEELARVLTTDEAVVEADDLSEYLKMQKRMEISLPKPVVVRLEYFTVEINGDKINFFDDVYGKDLQVLQAIESVHKKPEQILLVDNR
jgi:murein L,D-transpeptidase YcbB/YkuD